VAAGAEGRGVGTGLVRAALRELEARCVGSVRVVTASRNDPAIQMYTQCGFRRASRTEVHRGVQQDVLVWP